MRIPESLVGPVSELLAEHTRSAAAIGRIAQRRRKGLPSQITIPAAGSCSIVGPVDAMDLLNQLARQKVRAAVVVLDPIYRRKNAIGRAAYLSETVPLIEAASRIASHVFVWGFPASVGRLVDHWPSSLEYVEWLTWYAPNIASRGRSWRPCQQACLHLRHPGAPMYPEHFYAEGLKQHAARNKLEFKTTPNAVIEAEAEGPPSVVKAGSLHGSIDRKQQTGFKGGQKPEIVIERLLRMTTKPGDLVVDPTAGSGTTGAVSIKLGCASIISDRTASALKICRKRLGQNA